MDEAFENSAVIAVFIHNFKVPGSLLSLNMVEEAPGFLGNLSKYPDGIYGTTNEIEEFARASMMDTDDFWMNENIMDECINEVSDIMNDIDIEEEMNKMEREYGTSDSREEHKMRYSKRFKLFVEKELKRSESIEDMSDSELAKCLRRFYHSLRRNDNKPYKPATLICIRAGISNYLTDAPVSRSIDIINGCEFKTANNMLKSMVGYWLEKGDEDIKHYDGIEKEDERRMYAYFDRSSPTRLQDEVWYIIVMYFGLRGREGLRNLSKNSLEAKVDSNNKRYWTLRGPQKSKNNKPSLSQKKYTSVKQGRIYEDPESNSCPYSAIEQYLTKILHCRKDTLFPKPRKEILNNQWYYENQVLGKDLLGGMMTRISVMCSLSKTYTNHCIRSTYIRTLKDAGFRNDEVCAITGHKDERSIARYDRRQDDRVLDKMSTILTKKRKLSDYNENVSNVSLPVTTFMQKSQCQSLFNNCTFNNCTFS